MATRKKKKTTRKATKKKTTKKVNKKKTTKKKVAKKKTRKKVAKKKSSSETESLIKLPKKRSSSPSSETESLIKLPKKRSVTHEQLIEESKKERIPLKKQRKDLPKAIPEVALAPEPKRRPVRKVSSNYSSNRVPVKRTKKYSNIEVLKKYLDMTLGIVYSILVGGSLIFIFYSVFKMASDFPVDLFNSEKRSFFIVLLSFFIGVLARDLYKDRK